MKKIFAILFILLLTSSGYCADPIKISALTAQSQAIADGDLLVGVDVSDTSMAATGTTKKLTWTQVISYLSSVFQGADADLSDLADGSLSGSKIGTGISGDNVTTGTIADDRIASTIARDSEIPALVSTVRTTAGGGSTTAAPQEAAIGDALGGKEATLNAAGVVAKFASGACSGYLKSDGGCDTPSGAAHDAVTIGATPNGLSIATQVLSLAAASTTTAGAAPQATAPAAGLYNYLGITNGETVYTNKALFDATSPSTQAFSDSAAVGSAAVAARRDHKHAMPASPAVAPLSTVRTTAGGGSTTAASQEAAIGDALAGKLDAGDVTTVSANVETFLGSANLAAMLTNLGIPGLSATTGPVVIVGNAGGSSRITVPNATVNLPAGDVVNRTASETLTNKTLGSGSIVGTGTTVPVVLTIAASDEATAITAGAGKRKFRAPYAFTLTGVRCSVGTAPTGANMIIDVNETGTTSVLATKVTIEASEYSSVDATTQPVVGDSGIADNADMSIDFDQVGSTIAGAGVKCNLYGTRVLP
ncbi:MAG: hypothetical protein ACOYB1_18475 [Limnohabitans sp.]